MELRTSRMCLTFFFFILLSSILWYIIFQDNPYVLGYEYMNEPWIGDYFQDPGLSLPGYAAKQNLVPAYDVITEMVREEDPDNGIVFYEPMIYGQLLEGSFTGAGFEEVPGGDQYRNMSSYSWHAYCWALEFVGSNATDEEREEARDFCDTELLPTMFESAQVQVNITGGVAILTEFGLCIGDEETDVIDMKCDTFVNLADEYLMGWTEWDYNGSWYTNGERNWPKILPHVRPYAQRTAGFPISMHFDTETLEFNYEYEANLDITAPTEIFLPPVRYPSGANVTVSEGFEVSQSADRFGLFLVVPSETNAGQTNVRFLASSLSN